MRFLKYGASLAGLYSVRYTAMFVSNSDNGEKSSELPVSLWGHATPRSSGIVMSISAKIRLTINSFNASFSTNGRASVNRSASVFTFVEFEEDGVCEMVEVKKLGVCVGGALTNRGD